jgi:aldehyde dehydrogenase (NAD+)
VEKTRGLTLGYGLEDGAEIGPLINETAFNKVQSYMEIGRSEARLVIGGGARPGRRSGRRLVLPAHHLRGREARLPTGDGGDLGPVLSVIRFSDVDEAFRINNEVKYGLSSSVYTRDVTSRSARYSTWTTASPT